MRYRNLVLLSAFIPCVCGYCFETFGRIDKTVSGQEIPVCEYNGLDILDGSLFVTPACEECYCADGILSCCGFGVSGPKISPPAGCKTVADGCQAVLVKQYDSGLDCYTGEPITYSFDHHSNDESDSISGGSTLDAMFNQTQPFLNQNLPMDMNNNMGDMLFSQGPSYDVFDGGQYGGQNNNANSEANMIGSYLLMSNFMDFPSFL